MMKYAMLNLMPLRVFWGQYLRKIEIQYYIILGIFVGSGSAFDYQALRLSAGYSCDRNQT